MQENRPLRSTRRLSNRSWDRPAWYTISNSAAAGPVQVTIYDEIGFYGVSAGQFMADLDGIPGDIEMHINSPGGDIYDGITIYNRLKQRKGSIHVIVDGLAASAASFIAMAASPGMLEMAPRSEMMIHNGFTMAIGDAADLRKTADLLDKKTADIADMYAERSGKPADYWLGKMKEETWYSADEAVADGLADRIQGQEGSPATDWDMSVFARYAGDHGLALQNTAQGFVNSDGNHAPMSGSHAHAHPAYGAQGSDDSHSHEHSHDGDASHGHTHDDPDGDGDDDTTASGDTDHDYAGATPPKKVPGNRVIFPVLDADVDNSAWDASKAWSAGAASDDPAAFYRGICAGRKAGDPSTQGAWALPYKYSPSSAPNASGVRNALSRLQQTQGLTNESEARATLEKAMKAVSPDYDPDDSIDTELLAELFSIGLEGSR